MSASPILAVHICSGVVGLLSGAVAVSLRKGSRRHRIAGMVFAISMLSLAGCGVYLAFIKHRMGDVLGGTLTLYLVVTAWVTARRRDGKPSMVDWGALVVALALVTVTATWALQAANSETGMKNGYPPGVYMFLGSVALIAAVGDVRMLLRGGISGTPRLVRHLWRMCYALFIASASIFLARPHLFPKVLQTSGVLYFLTVLPLLLMFFWLIRVRFAREYKRKLVSVASSAYSLRA